MTSTFTITQSAADRVKLILEKDGKGAKMLRIGVMGGGCSGFSYTFDFATEASEDDVVFERDGAQIVVDEVSLPFLDGAEVDYVNEIIGSAFRINNPNASSACGCGTSFALS